jgi:hypothetical protein
MGGKNPTAHGFGPTSMALIEHVMTPLFVTPAPASGPVTTTGQRSHFRVRRTSPPPVAPCRAIIGCCVAGICTWLLLFLLVSAARPVFAVASETWQTLEDGLELGIFTAPSASAVGDSKIRILRIDPARFELKLVNASASTDGTPRTPREWSRQHGLVAAINASMYQADYRTSVSLMRTRVHTNNPRLSKDKAVLAFDPLDPGVPPIQIIDRSCQDFDSLQGQYGTLVQSIRMVSCAGRNVWKQGLDKWSTAAIGMDAKGRILFIHVSSPYTTHDLIDFLLALPIELRNTMYVEGGPQAQLYVASGGQQLELSGSHLASFLLGDNTVPASAIPNVVGIVRRADRTAVP